METIKPRSDARRHLVIEPGEQEDEGARRITQEYLDANHGGATTILRFENFGHRHPLFRAFALHRQGMLK